jgi:hypothetical protein
MACESGVLAQEILENGVYKQVFVLPLDQPVAATVIVRLINNDQANATTIRLYACPPDYAGGDPTRRRVILPLDKPLLAGAMTETTSFVIGAGWQIVAFAPSSLVTCAVWGHAK